MNKKNTVTGNHISKTSSDAATNSLIARKEILQEYISGEIPHNFEAYRSNQKLVDWNAPELGIKKIALNTAKSRKKLWKELAALCNQIKERVKMEKIQALKVTPEKVETQTKLQAQKKVLSEEVKNLTNELITLRVAYLDLLRRLEEREIKDFVLRESIIRHKQHHGLQLILDRQDNAKNT